MKKIITFFITLITILQVSAQCVPNRYNVDAFTNIDVSTVQFGQAVNSEDSIQDLFMDIYQPQGDTLENRPVVVLAFGGSFVAGTRDAQDMVYFATEFAKKGYVCASIDYRLESNAFNLINEEVMVKTVFNAVQDGKAAIRYFRQDAATDNNYKINPDQIFMGGTSAGGILAINLAYMDDINKLPTNWQQWANDIGSIEGTSGNPGYCSKVNGVFGFAGAVADTAWIEADDVPIYNTHCYDDGTVVYGYGPPLGGLAPVSLYGSGPMETRMNNLGTYSVLDDYTGDAHPPFADQDAATAAMRLADTEDNLTTFLYNILDCNPSSLVQADVDKCDEIQATDCIDRYHTAIFDSVVIDTTILFGHSVVGTDTLLDLYMDIYHPFGDVQEDRPLIVFAFGGSFIGGNRRTGDMTYLASEFAKRGYVCASIDYRLANAVDLLSEENMVKEVLGAVQDGKAAIRYFRNDAATINAYNIDPNQIFAGGTSAGGILGINLTYANDINKLPAQWQTWMNEIGGIDGNGGNPGYDSYPNGTFGFAGAIADPTWIEAGDVPVFMTHSHDDATVPFIIGAPLNGLAPVDLYGSKSIAARKCELGEYYILHDYEGDAHPPFAGTIDISETRDNLSTFLYSILECNPNNQLGVTGFACDDVISSIKDINTIDASIYPNPTNKDITVAINANDLKNASVHIYNTVGQQLYSKTITEINSTISLADFNQGLYLIEVASDNGNFVQRIVKK